MADLAEAFSTVKSLPDHMLEHELASPTGMIPGWLALGEMHERKALRATHGGTNDPKPKSMAEQYAGDIAKTVAGSGFRPQMQPQGGMPGGMPPPQPGPPQQGGIAALPQQQPQGYANGGIVGLAGGGYLDRLRQIAIEEGVNPDVALRVVRGEGGLSNPFQHGLGPAPRSQLASLGPTENSYGPLQLYISGSGAGLGDRALKAGFDPRKDWEGAYRYGLDEVKRAGWGQWYGAKKAGITGMMGVGGRPAGAPVAVAQADPATGAAVVPVTPVATTDTAGADTATTDTAEAGLGGGDQMSQLLLMSQLMGGKGQPQAAAPPAAPQMVQARPVDASQYVQDPVFMARMRSQNYA